ncbi:MAG: FAD:protein FMN transferase [Limisphaerales bacterium]
MELRLARHAMATRFELVLHGESATRLRGAGEEALDEVTRLEAALSLYRSDSEISALNRAAAAGWVRVSPEVAALVARALTLAQATGGAFDPTVAPLIEAWGLRSGTGRVPSDEELAAARAAVGAHLVEADPAGAVRFLRPGVRLDLGSIGKGYALDRAAVRLREAGVMSALLHGGTSSVVALGAPPGEEAWRVAVDVEANFKFQISNPKLPPPPDEPPSTIHDLPLTASPSVFALRDESLSVSAVWGKGFTADGRFRGHVLDPRTGRPVEVALLAAIGLPSATDSDALSTALLVRGAELAEKLRAASPPVRCLVMETTSEAPGWRITTAGL